MTLQDAIKAAKESLQKTSFQYIYGPPDQRWMPAVLIRKRDLRLLIQAAAKGAKRG
jgi:hypothetical protein